MHQKERTDPYYGRIRIIDRELGYCQEPSPVGLVVIDEVTEKIFDRLIYAFNSTVNLWVESCGNLSLDSE
jgi:hypothetical protein